MPSSEKTRTDIANRNVFARTLEMWLQQYLPDENARRLAEHIERRKERLFVDGEYRVICGVVYEPDSVDTHGDCASAEEIRMAMEGYNRHRTLGVQHQDMLTNYKAEVIDSFIAPYEMMIVEERIRPGTWLMVIAVYDNEIWERVREGKLTGLSMGGRAVRRIDGEPESNGAGDQI